MGDFFSGLLVGAFLGLFIGAMTHGLFSGAFDAINKCQEPLPRNQVCVLTAVPEREAGSHE